MDPVHNIQTTSARRTGDGNAVAFLPQAEATTRRGFLQKSLIAVGGATATLALASRGSANPEVNAFYTDQGRRAFQSIQKHEGDHVKFLVGALGSAKRPQPTFRGLNMSDINQFVDLARVFENVGTSAYLFAAPFLNNRQFIAQAGSIATVEARQAGALELLTGGTTTQFNMSFDTARSPEEVAAAIAPFIASLNGGKPPGFAREISDRNDIDILNYALALEFLENEFYNLNVPKFFP